MPCSLCLLGGGRGRAERRRSAARRRQHPSATSPRARCSPRRPRPRARLPATQLASGNTRVVRAPGQHTATAPRPLSLHPLSLRFPRAHLHLSRNSRYRPTREHTHIPWPAASRRSSSLEPSPHRRRPTTPRRPPLRPRPASSSPSRPSAQCTSPTPPPPHPTHPQRRPRSSTTRRSSRTRASSRPSRPSTPCTAGRARPSFSRPTRSTSVAGRSPARTGQRGSAGTRPGACVLRPPLTSTFPNLSPAAPQLPA